MKTSPLIDEARAFAIEAHGEQRYGDAPYVVHLDAVATTLAPYGETAVVVGYLHDVVEDTAVAKEALVHRFSAHIAACVSIVTDVPGPNRKARKAATHAKLSEVEAEAPEALALVVKAADRLCNLRACAAGRADLLRMYADEHPAFREAAHRPGLCDPLWEEMERILAGAAGPPL